jgi:hypothetical protein
LALTRRDMPSRISLPEKATRHSLQPRSEAESTLPSDALGRLSLRLNPVSEWLLRPLLP